MIYNRIMLFLFLTPSCSHLNTHMDFFQTFIHQLIQQLRDSLSTINLTTAEFMRTYLVFIISSSDGLGTFISTE